MEEPKEPPNADRREFLKKASAVVIGAVATAAPIGAGIATLIDPLRRKSEAMDLVFVTTIGSLPENGAPVQFPIIASRTDAWSKFPNARIGAVYLRKTGDKKVEALNVVCPHAGCFVAFRPADKIYFCPCHNSSFGLDGQIVDKRSPSPRALDTLSVEIRNEREIWVKFQNFRTGTAHKIPVA